MQTHPDSELEAFLHIVHVSDIHCKGPAFTLDVDSEAKVRKVIRRLRYVGAAKLADYLEQRWQSGLAGHDPRAHGRMCEFLKYFAKHKNFAGIETWLLDTGDLSTLGDFYSLKTALGWLDEYQSILKATQTLVLHGNHDAWPGKFPLAATDADIAHHQRQLQQLMNQTWPQTSIQTAIPHSQAKLRLNALNSTIGDRLQNTFARGYVGKDPTWATCSETQLDQLESQTLKDLHVDGVTRDFRVLALHHPVHYPPPCPTMQMSLRNDDKVAQVLGGFSKHGRGMLAHLVLSGHTHETYPAPGALPPTSTGQQYNPLYEGQVQLITGSLMQSPRRGLHNLPYAESFPQQFQILTFFTSRRASERQQLLMERRVIGRNSMGSYRLPPLPVSGKVESIIFEY